MKPFCILAIIIPLTSFGQNFALVKNSAPVDFYSAGARDRVPIVVSISRIAFIPTTPAPTPGPSVPDPRVVTVNPYSIFTGACNLLNLDSDPRPDSIRYMERFASLSDLGEHTFALGGDAVLYVAPSGYRCVRADPTQPCGWFIDTRAECRAPVIPTTFSVTVFNNPPTANILMSPAPAFGVTSVIDARLADPDPGSNSFPQEWTVIARPPGSTANLSNPSTSRPSMRFATWQDIGMWRLGLSFQDNQGEMFVISGGHGFEPANQPPTISIDGRPLVNNASKYFVGETVDLTARTSDPEGAPLSTVRWTVISPPGPLANTTTSDGPVVQRNGQPFIARAADRGHWIFRARVEDHRGLSAQAERIVTIENRRPTIMLSGNMNRYVMGQTISMRANAVDPDGGPVTVRWTVERGPSARLGSTISTSDQFNLAVSAAEIAQWEIRVTATDDENESTEEVYAFVVENLPPRISIPVSSHVIGVNQTIQFGTAVQTDDDGGPLTFRWSYRQLPFAGGSGPSLGTGSYASFGTSAAGTWIVRLEATDDDGAPNSTVHEDITIVVDDVPYVQISGPQRATPSNPWINLHAMAEDPDSPCEGTSHRCHSTVSGFPQSISPGIVQYDWSVLSSPVGAGSLQTIVPSLGGQSLGALVGLTSGSLPAPGLWFFGVTVRDAEGHSANASISVDVVASTRPTAFVKPRVSTVTQQGYALGDFFFDGSLSFDEDNQSDGVNWPGILAHEWLFVPPTTCPLSPGQFYGPYSVLIPRGGMLPASCAGRWVGNLTVVDDDVPGQTGAFGFEFAVTSCPQGVCFDSPRTGQPTVVNPTSLPVEIAYVVDSFAIDKHNLTASGIARFRIEDSTGRLIREWADTSLRAAPKLSTIVTTWDGRDTRGRDAPTGTYSVKAFIETGSTVVASGSVKDGLILERPTITTSPASLNFQTERFGLGPTSLSVSASGFDRNLPPVSIFGELVDSFGRQVRNFGLLSAAPVSWDGTTTGGGNAGGQVLPGDYQLRLRVTRLQNGNSVEVMVQSLPVAVFSLQLVAETVGARPSGEVPRTTLELWTNSTPSAADFAWASLKMAPLTVTVRRGARVRLSASAASSAIFAENGTQLPLPHEWQSSDFSSVNSTLTKKLFAHATSMARNELRLDYLDSAGSVLGSERIALQAESLHGYSGLQRPTSPFIESARQIQAGQALTVAVSPVVFPDREGKRAVIHVLPHRSKTQWGGNRTLTGGSVTPPQTVTIQPGSLAANLFTAWSVTGVVSADSALPHSQGFDVVFDFGNFRGGAGFVADGRLDPGDLLLTPDWQPTVRVEDWGHTTYAGLDDTYSKPIVVENRDASGASFDTLVAALKGTLQGRVVAPKGKKSFPVVLIGHGNHAPLALEPFPLAPIVTSAENYEGYRYLQDFLAERGVASISVSLDDLYNRKLFVVSHGIRSRAWFMLKNLEYALANVSILKDADPARLYLAGHSRGGQAAIDAEYLIAHPAEWPRLGTLGLLSSQIKGVVALAPTSYDISSKQVLRRVPLAVAHGTADGDVVGSVQNVLPFLHVDRGSVATWGARVPGANHNFFNTSWVPDDANVEYDPSIKAFVALNQPLLPVADLISDSVQRAVACHFVGRFVSGVEGGTELARSSVAEPARLATILSQFRTPGGSVLDDFESGSGPTTSSGTLSSWTASVKVDEVELLDPHPLVAGDLQDRFFQFGKGALLTWAGPSVLSIPVPVAQEDFRQGQTLSLRIAQAPQECTTRLPLTGLSLELRDDWGRSDSFPFPPVGKVHTAVQDGLSGTRCISSATFETVQVPILHFKDRAGLDLGRVKSLNIMGSSGVVGLDNIEVLR